MDDIIPKLKNYLSKNTKIKLALIFGSYAKGKANPKSDLDLAIAYDTPLTFEQIIEIAQDISAFINLEVDLVDLRTASGLILQQIIANRKTLINRDSELYGNIIAKQITEAADFMPLYEAILKAKRERFVYGQKGRYSENR